MPIKQIDINDTTINYFEEGINTPVIFLHGWGQTLESFRYFYEPIAKNHHVYALDLPGFGNSSEPTHAMSIFDYEAILSRFIKKLELKNPVIVAHSFGCRIATIYAAKSDNLSKLVFTGAAGLKPKRDLKYHLSVVNYKFMKILVKTPFYFQYKDDLYSNSGSSDYKNASPIMKQVLINTVNEDLASLFANIKVETLLYWGRDDVATPLSDGQVMKSRIKNSRLEIKDGTHYAFLENKEDFLIELLAFLK